VVAAPSAAVLHGPDGLAVDLVDPQANTVKYHPIKVVRQEGDTYVVSSGLDQGNVVVVAGQSRLQDGAHIAINRNNQPQPQRSGT
jgi:multidrug efflux system membrane fusion protein